MAKGRWIMLTDKQILEPIRDFLMTYPYTTPVGEIEIDYGQVEQTGSDASGEGNALRLTGRIKTREQKSVTGVVTETWRINFALVMRRDTNDNNLRKEISEFILQFIEWVNASNRKRGKEDANPKLPAFSDTEKETISADGGGQTAMLPSGRDEFQIALHLEYQKQYRA